MSEQTKPKAYTAWLIERIDLGYPLYWSGPSKSNEFSDNIDKAVKFRFQEDAERVLRKMLDVHPLIGPLYAVRSHQWGFTDELLEGA